MNTDQHALSQASRRSPQDAGGAAIVPQASRLPRRMLLSRPYTLHCKALSFLQHRMGWVGTIVLMLPVYAWVWVAAKEPVLSVLRGSVFMFFVTGDVFTVPFQKIHAGGALDQPTIGKWLFWFTAMSITTLPYTYLVGWLANRMGRKQRITYSVCVGILCFMLLSILSWPLSWLIQYVSSMGWTLRRLQGLIYASNCGVLILLFTVWATRKQQPREPRSDP